jgi:HEAT repeat protein
MHRATAFLIALLITLVLLSCEGPKPEPSGQDNAMVVMSIEDPDELIELLADDAKGSLAQNKLMGMGADAVPILISNLSNENPTIRKRVCNILGAIGPASADIVPGLIETLEDEVTEVAGAAMFALERIGPDAKDATPALIQIISEGNIELKDNAAITLAFIGPNPDEVVPVLIDALDEEYDSIRLRAYMALFRSMGNGSKDAVPAILDVFARTGPPVRDDVARALAAVAPDDKRVLDALIGALKDEVGYLQRDIASGDYANSTSVQSCYGIIRALGECGEYAVEAQPLITGVLNLVAPGQRLIDDTFIWLTNMSIHTWSKIAPADETRLPVALGFLVSDKPQLREAAAHSIGVLGPKAAPAVEAFIIALADKQPGVRYNAAEALGKIGPGAADAVKYLEELATTDENNDVRQAAEVAVELINS